ncbi:MAG: BrnT family toxin, partial [Thermoanaerobaculia bacterium]
FKLAEQIFDDPLHATRIDARHSNDEDRYITIGETWWGEILVVAHAERNGRTRIISARRARRIEKRDYMDKSIDTINDRDIDIDDLEPEYDFKGAVRGMFYRPGRSIIRMTIDEDVARYYGTSELVNTALRQLIAEGRAPEPRDE